MSDCYGAPLGLSLRALLPGALWRVERPAGPAEHVERVVVLIRALPALLEREEAFRRAPKRRAAHQAPAALGGSHPPRPPVGPNKPSPPRPPRLGEQGPPPLQRPPQP